MTEREIEDGIRLVDPVFAAALARSSGAVRERGLARAREILGVLGRLAETGEGAAVAEIVASVQRVFPGAMLWSVRERRTAAPKHGAMQGRVCEDYSQEQGQGEGQG